MEYLGNTLAGRYLTAMVLKRKGKIVRLLRGGTLAISGLALALTANIAPARANTVYLPITGHVPTNSRPVIPHPHVATEITGCLLPELGCTQDSDDLQSEMFEDGSAKVMHEGKLYGVCFEQTDLGCTENPDEDNELNSDGTYTATIGI